jgi:3-(methylthio)propionyl---CoA ligase
MTETSPSGTSPQPSRRTAKLSSKEKVAQKTSQGHPLYGVDLKIADDLGNGLPRDGSPPDG